ncbi:MAG: alpha/beta fold hydrolase [Candidatus Bathyarchaeota archaeon]|jgi:dipeptidyl aminopeptidase/acylaminoacyl peptidase|nr:alpha/beta fold hydrolase [Candidatus Bathyarchaeota archaeon]
MSRRYSRLGNIEGTIIRSEGADLLGTIYIGLGEGKRPTALLLHGLPGFEKNVDIAYGLREIGWNVLLPRYRGCWGSEGKYRFTGVPTDVKNSITHMVTKPYVDKEKIFLIGHSLGAWATIIATAQDQRVKGGIAIAGGISQKPTEAEARGNTHVKNLIEQKFIKNITFEEAVEDLIKRGSKLASQDWIGKISPRPLLMIGGEHDEAATPERVKALYTYAKKPKKLVMIKDADHVFTKQRRKLVKAVTDWLKEQV